MSLFILFFKQKTAYEMRISDWSSDVCSSDLIETVDFALIVDLIVEECAEFSAAPLGRGVRHHGDQLAQVKVAGHRLCDTAEHPQALDFRCSRNRFRRFGRSADRKSTRLNSSH